MASQIDIWSLYKFRLPDDSEEYVLIRTSQPSYPNWSQTQENFAGQIEMEKRERLLELFCQSKNLVYKRNFSFIGEFNGYPESGLLTTLSGLFRLGIYYAETEYGHPWIILDCHESEIAFLNYFKSEEYEKDYGAVKIKGKPIQVDVFVITENDFDLSSVKHFDLKDTRPLFNE